MVFEIWFMVFDVGVGVVCGSYSLVFMVMVGGGG